MFNFFKNKVEEGSYSGTIPVKTDIHSHILPGLDDGSPDVETSLRLIRGLYKLGIRKSIATPHIIGDLYQNNPEKIRAALKILKDACAAEHIDIELGAAAEYMLDDHFVRLLNEKAELLTISGNIILTEQSYAAPTGNLNEIAFELMKNGYKPIMAHPERYFYYHTNFENYHHLKDMGFLLQVNLLSLTGYYGPTVAKSAKFLFKEDLVDFVGTDLHHDKHLKLLEKKENQRVLEHYVADRVFNEF